jgi:micrococcal nuclease
VPSTLAGEQCLGAAGDDAKRLAESTLLNERVTLVFDSEADRRGYYGRLLAYVHVDGGNFNYRLVEDGHARVYDSTFSESESFYAAESDAQSAEANLWSCRTPESGDDVTITQIHEDAWGDDGDHLNDEYVTIENTGGDTVDLSGWTVTDEAGKTYTFPSGVSLSPGESVTLHSGSGTDTSTDRYWDAGSPVWNNGGDTVTVSNDGGTYEAAITY